MTWTGLAWALLSGVARGLATWDIGPMAILLSFLGTLLLCRCVLDRRSRVGLGL